MDEKPKTTQVADNTATPETAVNTGTDAKKQRHFKGLMNQGNTCYMSSLIQALFMTPDFREMIFKWR